MKPSYLGQLVRAAALAGLVIPIGNAVAWARPAAYTHRGAAPVTGAMATDDGWISSPAIRAPAPGTIRAPNWGLLTATYGSNLGAGGRLQWAAPPILLSSGVQVGLVTQNDVMGSPIPNVGVVAFSSNGKPLWHFSIPSPNVATSPVWTGKAIAFVADLPPSGGAANNSASSVPTLVLLNPSGTEVGSYSLAALIPSGTTASGLLATPPGLLLELQRGRQPNATTQFLGLSSTGSALWEASPVPGLIPSGGLAVLGNLVVVETVTSSADGANPQDTLRTLNASTGKTVWVSVESPHQYWTLEAAVGRTTIWRGYSRSGKPGWIALAAATGKQMWARAEANALNEDAWGPSQWVQCNGTARCTLASITTGAVEGIVQLLALPQPHRTGLRVIALSSHFVVLGVLESLPPYHNYTWVLGINGRHYQKSYAGSVTYPLEYSLPSGAFVVNTDESRGAIPSLAWK